MCGITGFFNASGTTEVGDADLERAVVALRNRGPDDEGRWTAGIEAGLGQTRLAIIDLSEHGHQPMFSADRRLAMVFNGEIYNFAPIRAELIAKGHSFRGTGDSETILAAVREWGLDAAIGRFVGMFAIALWDTELGTLTLVRDRLGVKPLYYGWNGRTLWFGSELKALRAYAHWEPRIDRAAMADFFRFSYIVEPRSIYEGVRKLEPGHILTLARGGEPQLRRYWNVQDGIRSREGEDEEVLADELETLMTDAFALRTVADVPVAMFLSGGVDSSVVTALLQQNAKKTGAPPLRTFTIGFDDPKYNEAHHAAQIARHLGTVHTERIVREAEAMQVLPGWGELYDEPFGDSSGIPTLLVSKMAVQHAKVVLSADGGDELFGGYNSYDAVFSRMADAQSRSTVGRIARDVASVLPWERMDGLLAGRAGSADPGRSVSRAMSMRLRYLRETRGPSSPGRIFEHVVTSLYWHDGELDRLLGAPAADPRRRSDDYPGSTVDQLSLWDLDHYLPGDVLAKVDRATMAVGIEGREPLLDHRVVEMALSLPEHLRRGTLGKKHLLKKVLYRHVPREMIERPKMGFAPPIGRWLAGELAPLLDQYLDTGRIARQGLLDPDTVATVLQRFRAGDPHSVQRVWLLLAFQLWHARWMEGTPEASRARAASGAGLPIAETA